MRRQITLQNSPPLLPFSLGVLLVHLVAVSAAATGESEKHDIEVKLYSNTRTSQPERGSTVRLPLKNFYGSVWTTSVGIGNPPREFDLMIDTGSTDSWLMSRTCDTKACNVHTLYDTSDSVSSNLIAHDFKVMYTTGEVTGRTIEDECVFGVTLGDSDGNGATGSVTQSPVKINFRFGIISDPPMTFQKRYRWYPFDGVLALGTGLDSEESKASPLSLLGSIWKQAKEGSVHNDDKNLSLFKKREAAEHDEEEFGGMFSLYFSRGKGKSVRGKSELIIGGPDDKLHEGSIHYIGAKRPMEFWSLRIRSMKLIGVRTEKETGHHQEEEEEQRPPFVSDETDENEDRGEVQHRRRRPGGATIKSQKIEWCNDKGDDCTAVFDTGSSLLSGPKAIVDKILLKNIKVPANCSKVSYLPDIEIEVTGSKKDGGGEENYKILLEPEDYVIRVPVAHKKQEACYLGITSHKFPESMGSLWVLGNRFHRKYYTVFDRRRERIGLAIAK